MQFPNLRDAANYGRVYEGTIEELLWVAEAAYKALSIDAYDSLDRMHAFNALLAALSALQAREDEYASL